MKRKGSRKTASAQHIEAMSVHLTSQLFKTLSIAEANTGTDHTGELFFNMLTKIIGAQIYSALTQLPPGIQEYEVENYVFASLQQTRQSVEVAVAAAFSDALSTYKGGGVRVEYGCSVRIVPDALNKEMI